MMHLMPKLASLTPDFRVFLFHDECSLKESVQTFTSPFMKQNNKKDARKIENSPKSIH